MFLRGLWDVSLNGDLIETCQRHLMSARVPLSEDEEDVGYDVETLFTNIPIKKSIDFICNEIYSHKKLKQSVNNLFLRSCNINLQHTHI